MKILFIRSGNHSISPISTLQGKSLEQAGVQVFYFDIIGKGIKGYLKNLYRLRRVVQPLKVDLIHAHYSFSGFLATLAFSGRPVITSLMGSDIKSDNKFRFLVFLFSRFFWKKTIVKSADMYRDLGIKSAEIIPNGVDLSQFYEIDKFVARKILNLPSEEIIVLFAADPNRPEKNFELAQEAIRLAGSRIKTMYLKGVQPEQVKYYYNAADVVLLTSLWEGSPNVIKESMACNRPIVATRVGDIEWLWGNEKGHFLTSYDIIETSRNINNAISYSLKKYKTDGRNRLIHLELDSVTIAKHLINIYKSIL